MRHIPPLPKKSLVRKLFTLLGHVCKIVENVKICFLTMFPYTIKHTESECDIQNNDLLYKIHQQHQSTFEPIEFFEERTRKYSNDFFIVIGILYKIHSLYIAIFVFWVILYSLYISYINV